MHDCLVSHIVLCRRIPFSTSLPDHPCLNQLLSDQIESNYSCPIERSTDIETRIIEIGKGLRYIFPKQSKHSCKIHSTLSTIIETITIIVESLIHVPCDKILSCFGNQLYSSLCEDKVQIILPSLWNTKNKDEIFQIPMTDLKSRMISSYRSQRLRTYQDIINDLNNNRSFLRNYVNEISHTIISIFLFVLFSIILYVVRYLKRNFQTDLDTLKEIIHHTLSH